jgi:N utilization substance protein B
VNAASDPRHLAREAALQMLYQWEVGGDDLDETIRAFDGLRLRPPDDERDRMAEALARGTAATLDRIDPLITRAVHNWRLSRLSVIDRLVLRLAVYELLTRPDIPPRVVINEALELARTFSTDDAVKFVNGVLDAIWRRIEEEKDA